MGSCVSSHEQWIAKEDFHPEEVKDEDKLLVINKDDKLKMINDHEFIEKDMYMMKNLSTKEVGLVSTLFVAKNGTIQCEPWYFGNINRRKAVDLLQAEINIAGSFLIRESGQFNEDYSLSVKTWDSKKTAFAYKHYRIRHIDERFYISETHQYSHLSDLVESCKRDIQRGLACKLTTICIKPSSKNPLTMWNIPKTEIVLKEELGKGNFGSVHKGIFRGEHTVAVKQLHSEVEGESMSIKAKREFMDEAKILKTLQHPHLVQVLGVCLEEPYLMVLEFLENGDLKSFLQKNTKSQRLNFDKLLLICEEVASGMQELGKLGIVHRDLAARNIMLDKWLQAKVGDFGLAREGGEYSNARTKFPVRWTAPEALKYKKFTLQSDIWSYGVVLWEVFTFGLTPYPNISNNSEILSWLESGNRLEIPKYDGTSDEKMELVYKVMLACWQEDPEARRSMKDLHSDLKDFGSEDMETNYAIYRYVKTTATDPRRREAMDKRKGPPRQAARPAAPQRTVPARRHK